jgi:outer membrane protein OmpA-like peptidoglycan-associated protein
VIGQVGQVSGKVDSLSKSLEDTQQRTKQNEARITEVDQKTAKAQGTAEQAGQAAMTADTKAVAATEAAKAVRRQSGCGQDLIDKERNKMVYEVVLSEDNGNFKFGKAVLPDEAKAHRRADRQAPGRPQGRVLRNRRPHRQRRRQDDQRKLGLARAETVKRYLYEQYKIPLHRMNVISYGEEKPASDNKTKDGRAQNRRVVIRVLV